MKPEDYVGKTVRFIKDVRYTMTTLVEGGMATVTHYRNENCEKTMALSLNTDSYDLINKLVGQSPIVGDRCFLFYFDDLPFEIVEE